MPGNITESKDNEAGGVPESELHRISPVLKHFSSKSPLSDKERDDFISTLFHSFNTSSRYAQEYYDFEAIKQRIEREFSTWKTLIGVALFSSGNTGEIIGGRYGQDLFEVDEKLLRPIQDNPEWTQLKGAHEKIFYGHSNFVSPPYRGQGHSDTLRNAYFKHLKEKGYTLVLARTGDRSLFTNYYSRTPGFIPLAVDLTVPDKVLARNYYAIDLNQWQSGGLL